MSHSISTRYTRELEYKISVAFINLRKEYESVEKNCRECCLEESRTPERMEDLKKSLDALCGVSFQLLGYVTTLENLEHVSDFCKEERGLQILGFVGL